MAHPQDAALAASLASPDSFWRAQADQLQWHRPPTTILSRSTRTLGSGASHPSWQWFPDGEINTTTNCLDRHVAAGHGDQPALIYDSPVTSTKQSFTYTQLLTEVELLAAVLKEEGVRPGDVVLIYMPMIPQALIACLATLRLGAIHAVVFGGFSGASLAQRIDASGATLILTASCGIEGAKGPVSYQPMVRTAVDRSRVPVKRVLVWQRKELRWDDVDIARGERNWGKLVRSAKGRDMRQPAVGIRCRCPILRCPMRVRR